MTRKTNKDELLKYIKNLFNGNDIMFIYYCGSDSYKTRQANSDTDVVVVLRDLKGVIHAATDNVDIFAYGYEDYLARQSINDALPLYNLIHADDVISIKDNLIFIDSLYEKELENIVKIDFTEVLPQFLDAVLEYYNNLILHEQVIVKREYHIIRVRAILDNYLTTGKYSVLISEEWMEKLMYHKNNWSKLKDKEGHLELLKQYLIEIKEIRDEI